MLKRITFEGDFCDIALCGETRYGSFCEDGSCSQRKVWERLKEYEDTGFSPEEVKMFNRKGESVKDNDESFEYIAYKMGADFAVKYFLLKDFAKKHKYE